MRISDWSSDVCSSDLAGACASGRREERAAVDHGALHAALHRQALEGAVLGLAGEAVGLDLPGALRVEDHEVGGRSLGEAPGVEPENLGGPDRKSTRLKSSH